MTTESVCAFCHHENRFGAFGCSHCGAPLANQSGPVTTSQVDDHTVARSALGLPPPIMADGVPSSDNSSLPTVRGWYTRAGDPPGVQRWWDGMWSDRTTGNGLRGAASNPNGPLAAFRPELAPFGHPQPNIHPPAQPAGGVPPVLLAGMGARLGARLIDSVIVLIGLWVLVVVVEVLGILSPIFALLIYIGLWFYQIGFTGLTGQTPGKRLLGIKVVDARSGDVIGIGRAAGREIVLGLSGLLCMIGYFSPLFDSTGRYRGWHDNAADDLVVRA